MNRVENFGNGLHRLVYVSRMCAIGPADLNGEVEAIVAVSQRNNAAVAVTGMLLAYEGCFVQALEGSHQTISDLYDRIACDERHTDLKIIGAEAVASRTFGGWSMRAGRRPANPGEARFDPYVMSAKDLTALLSLSAALSRNPKRAAA